MLNQPKAYLPRMENSVFSWLPKWNTVPRALTAQQGLFNFPRMDSHTTNTDTPNRSKWWQARHHFFRNLTGFSRFLFGHPLFATKLLIARANYFFTRRLVQPISTPSGFIIETTRELVSYWSFFVEGECLTPDWVKVLLSETKPVVVDVGANAGLFSHRVWVLKPDAQFILFEPLPRMTKKIANWTATTGASCTLHNKAVSDKCGTATFFASSDNDTAASLKPEADKSLKLEVEVLTLDSIIPDRPILVLKIDVEGFEFEVISGASQTIKNTTFLIVEAHTQTDFEKIKSKLGNEWSSKRVGVSDYLFFRRTPST